MHTDVTTHTSAASGVSIRLATSLVSQPTLTSFTVQPTPHSTKQNDDPISFDLYSPADTITITPSTTADGAPTSLKPGWEFRPYPYTDENCDQPPCMRTAQQLADEKATGEKNRLKTRLSAMGAGLVVAGAALRYLSSARKDDRIAQSADVESTAGSIEMNQITTDQESDVEEGPESEEEPLVGGWSGAT